MEGQIWVDQGGDMSERRDRVRDGEGEGGAEGDAD